MFTTRITGVMMWIVGALYGGYVMANALKWYWWRFNGHGYFWGMAAGIFSAMVVPEIAARVLGHSVNPLFLMPIIMFLSLAGCLVGTFVTPPEDLQILKSFYRTVRPWGFWGPVREAVLKEDSSFQPNENFRRDTLNVIVGIVWQSCLTALPIYIVVRQWNWVIALVLGLAVMSAFLKFNWYDKLEKA
jgi:hypothetical protein